MLKQSVLKTMINDVNDLIMYRYGKFMRSRRTKEGPIKGVLTKTIKINFSGVLPKHVAIAGLPTIFKHSIKMQCILIACIFKKQIMRV